MTYPQPELEALLRAEFAAQRELLWGLCYRMTGSAADADDLVQDTFERALLHPPKDAARSLRPWLARVAINLACDHLRRRKRAPYRGTWLPEPVPTEALQRSASPSDGRADTRYELLESTTFAFLLALEALTPSQRAVLLLRDVFDYSGRETADALELSEANVKTTLHRARAAMAGYDAQRCIPTPALRARTERVLRRFLAHLASDNVRAIEALLRHDVVTLNDPGDEFVAARKAVRGRAKVALFLRKIMRLVGDDLRFAIVDLNGLPAVASAHDPVRNDFAPREIFRIDIDAAGRIHTLHAVLAPGKLGRINFSGLRKPSLIERATARGLRAVLTRLQPRATRLSPHIQVHPRSRARRAAARS